jgi:hypothetical protein
VVHRHIGHTTKLARPKEVAKSSDMVVNITGDHCHFTKIQILEASIHISMRDILAHKY